VRQTRFLYSIEPTEFKCGFEGDRDVIGALNVIGRAREM